MKPFNLEAALAGAKVITRDGRPVKIAGYNPDGCEYSTVLAWAGQFVLSSRKDGKYHPMSDNDNDLFMAPTERKEWVVRVERHNGNKFISGPFSNEKEYNAFIESLSNGCTYTIHEILIHE